MDENGFGQPAAIGFAANEKAVTLRHFFQMFKKVNDDKDINVFFVDRDYTQLDVLNESWPSVPVLICAFHVMKTLKTNIAKEKLHVTEKQALLTSFKRALYCRTEESFKEKESEFLDQCTAGLREYYAKNWGNDPATWSFACRAQLRTFGNNTTNRIERFFLTVKTVLRGSGRSIAKRFHFSECIEIVLTVLDQKRLSSGLEDYKNAAK